MRFSFPLLNKDKQEEVEITLTNHEAVLMTDLEYTEVLQGLRIDAIHKMDNNNEFPVECYEGNVIFTGLLPGFLGKGNLDGWAFLVAIIITLPWASEAALLLFFLSLFFSGESENTGFVRWYLQRRLMNEKYLEVNPSSLHFSEPPVELIKKVKVLTSLKVATRYLAGRDGKLYVRASVPASVRSFLLESNESIEAFNFDTQLEQKDQRELGSEDSVAESGS